MAGTPTPAERAKSFLDGVLEHVPADQRDAVRAALSAPAALDYTGQHVLRQDEFSRAKDALAAKQTNLDRLIARNQEYYTENKPKVDRAIEILERGGRVADDDDELLGLDRNGDPPPPPRRPAAPEKPVMTKDEVAQTIAASEAGAIDYFAKLDSLRARHFAAFGELLDTAQMIGDKKRLFEIGIDALYAETFADKYAAKAQAQRDKDIADAVARGKAEGIAEIQGKLATAGPYPTPHALAATSAVVETLNQINTEVAGDAAKLAARGFKNRFDPNAAAVEYQQLVASGAAGNG